MHDIVTNKYVPVIRERNRKNLCSTTLLEPIENHIVVMTVQRTKSLKLIPLQIQDTLLYHGSSSFEEPIRSETFYVRAVSYADHRFYHSADEL